MKKQIYVDRSKPFCLPESTTQEFGSFTITEQDSRAAKIDLFTLNDVHLVSLDGKDLITAKEYRAKLLEEEYVPLDAFCASAIYKDAGLIRELSSMWFDRHWYLGSNQDLETINFFGSRLSDGVREHVLSFNYERGLWKRRGVATMIPYEADDIGWAMNRDYALVFERKFVAQHL